MYGLRIKQFRQKNKYSQRELGNMVGVSSRTVMRWEQNTNKPGPEEAKKIAALLGITVEELMSDMYYRQFFGDPNMGENYSSEEIASYRKATESVDTIMIMDWGLYNIIADEVNSYYQQKKDIKDIAHSMRSRIELYIEENYK